MMSIVSSSGARLRPVPKVDTEPARKPRQLGETPPEVRSKLVALLKIEGYEVEMAEDLFGISRSQVYIDRQRAMDWARRAAGGGPDREDEDADAA